MIPETTIAEIRERVDIAAFVGEYVRLKKSGSSFKGLCPFHNEKSPSFYVHPQRRFYHCFGCSASGDVFSFLMRAEGLSFPEAARRLAEKAGVELPRDDPEKDAVSTSSSSTSIRSARWRARRSRSERSPARPRVRFDSGTHPMAGTIWSSFFGRGAGLPPTRKPWG